ncbi:hypothetical protein PSYAC_28128 [Pseudomonas syringae pv. actinidiae str. M302091]|nr:hypothetical protein PSYAC_28128 [Pseudomonas syringae pv. actinidiae str. M302091]
MKIMMLSLDQVALPTILPQLVALMRVRFRLVVIIFSIGKAVEC